MFLGAAAAAASKNLSLLGTPKGLLFCHVADISPQKPVVYTKLNKVCTKYTKGVSFMYQIHDLWNGYTVNEMGKPSDCWFQSKEHLLFALQRLVVRPIPGRTINSKANRQLVDNSINMNGNDKSEQFVGFRTWGGARITIPVYENVLRRYMVKDEEGRIVDPRQWTETPQRPLPTKRTYKTFGHGIGFYSYIPKNDPILPVFRKDPVPRTGTRRYWYRGQPISGLKQSLVQKEERRGWDRRLEHTCFPEEDELLGFDPIRDRSKPRVSDRDPWGDSSHRFDVPGWKNTSKARRQWGKHKRGAKNIPNKRVEEELDFDALLEDMKNKDWLSEAEFNTGLG